VAKDVVPRPVFWSFPCRRVVPPRPWHGAWPCLSAAPGPRSQRILASARSRSWPALSRCPALSAKIAALAFPLTPTASLVR